MEQDFFIKLLNLSYQGSIAICVIILARFLLHMIKAPKKYVYYLWLFAFVRLVLPFSFESVLSILPQENEPIKTAIVYEQIPEIHTGSAVVNQVVNNVLPKATPEASMNPMQIVMMIAEVIWLAGIGIFVLVSVISFVRLKKRLVGSVQYTEGSKTDLSIASNAIYLSDYIETAFVLGFFRTRIYVPSTIGEREMSYIIMHEQAHIKRKDYIVKLILFGITILHWFNPLVWLAYVLVIQDMEMSCDEYVMKNYISNAYDGDIRKEYATSLLSLAVGRKLILGTPLAFGEGNVKGRIKNVTKYKKPLISVSICAVIGCIILGVALLSNPVSKTALPVENEDSQTDENTPEEGNETTEGDSKQTGQDMEEIALPIVSIDPNATLGADGPILDYADGNTVIFHGYFGLFVYDLSTQTLVRAVDLAAIGCHMTQGDMYCEVSVSEDGRNVYLHPMSLNEMYVLAIETGKLYKTAYNMEGIALFGKLTDNSALAGSGEGIYSAQKAVFGSGEQSYEGYLYAYKDSIGELSYAESDMIYMLFDSAYKSNPVLEGVSMSVNKDSVTPTGITFSILNTTDKEITAGEDYYLEYYENGKWYVVPYIIDNAAFNSIGYNIVKDEPFELTIDWEWLYGKLTAGKYRLVKDILDFRAPGDFDKYTLMVEFEVE